MGAVARKGDYATYLDKARGGDHIDQYEVWNGGDLVSTHAAKSDAVAEMNRLAGAKTKSDRTAMPTNGGGRWNIFQ